MSHDEVPSWVTLTAGEHIVWRGRPSLWPIAGRLALGIIIAVIGIIGVIFLTGVGGVLGVCVFLVGVGYAAVVYVEHQQVQYVLTSRELYRKTGLLSRSVTTLQLDHVRNTTIRQRFYQRPLAYGTVQIETASSDPDLVLSGITEPERIAWGITSHLGEFVTPEDAETTETEKTEKETREETEERHTAISVAVRALRQCRSRIQ